MNASQFSIRVIYSDEGALVIPAGELDIATVGVLEGALRDVERSGAAQIIIDLRHLKFVDSSGLRLLLDAQTGCRRNGHAVAFTRARDSQVLRLLTITALEAELQFLD